jgi:hypothetical protein
MTAMEAKLGSTRAVSRSTSGRARGDVAVSRVPPRMTAGAAPDEATKGLIPGYSMVDRAGGSAA